MRYRRAPVVNFSIAGLNSEILKVFSFPCPAYLPIWLAISSISRSVNPIEGQGSETPGTKWPLTTDKSIQIACARSDFFPLTKSCT